MLTQSSTLFEFLLSQECPQTEISIFIEDNGDNTFSIEPGTKKWDRYSFACLLQMAYELQLLGVREPVGHKQYSRKGMIKRVLAERRQKALSAEYRIKWAGNIMEPVEVSSENKPHNISIVPDEELTEDNIQEIEEAMQGQTEAENILVSEDNLSPTQTASTTTIKAEQMEQVMNNGMQFLSGLFQMATGQSIGIENQKIEINKETGEVTMKFKLPIK